MPKTPKDLWLLSENVLDIYNIERTVYQWIFDTRKKAREFIKKQRYEGNNNYFRFSRINPHIALSTVLKNYHIILKKV